MDTTLQADLKTLIGTAPVVQFGPCVPPAATAAAQAITHPQVAVVRQQWVERQQKCRVALSQQQAAQQQQQQQQQQSSKELHNNNNNNNNNTCFLLSDHMIQRCLYMTGNNVDVVLSMLQYQQSLLRPSPGAPEPILSAVSLYNDLHTGAMVPLPGLADTVYFNPVPFLWPHPNNHTRPSTSPSWLLALLYVLQSFYERHGDDARAVTILVDWQDHVENDDNENNNVEYEVSSSSNWQQTFVDLCHGKILPLRIQRVLWWQASSQLQESITAILRASAHNTNDDASSSSSSFPLHHFLKNANQLASYFPVNTAVHWPSHWPGGKTCLRTLAQNFGKYRQTLELLVEQRQRKAKEELEAQQQQQQQQQQEDQSSSVVLPSSAPLVATSQLLPVQQKQFQQSSLMIAHSSPPPSPKREKSVRTLSVEKNSRRRLLVVDKDSSPQKANSARKLVTAGYNSTRLPKKSASTRRLVGAMDMSPTKPRRSRRLVEDRLHLSPRKTSSSRELVNVEETQKSSPKRASSSRNITLEQRMSNSPTRASLRHRDSSSRVRGGGSKNHSPTRKVRDSSSTRAGRRGSPLRTTQRDSSRSCSGAGTNSPLRKQDSIRTRGTGTSPLRYARRHASPTSPSLRMTKSQSQRHVEPTAASLQKSKSKHSVQQQSSPSSRSPAKKASLLLQKASSSRQVANNVIGSTVRAPSPSPFEPDSIEAAISNTPIRRHPVEPRVTEFAVQWAPPPPFMERAVSDRNIPRDSGSQHGGNMSTSSLRKVVSARHLTDSSSPLSPLQKSKLKTSAFIASIEEAMAQSTIRRGETNRNDAAFDSNDVLAVPYTPPPTQMNRDAAASQAAPNGTGQTPTSLRKAASVMRITGAIPASPRDIKSKVALIHDDRVQSPIQRRLGRKEMAAQWSPVPTPFMVRAASSKHLSSGSPQKHSPRMIKAASARNLPNSPTKLTLGCTPAFRESPLMSTPSRRKNNSSHTIADTTYGSTSTYSTKSFMKSLFDSKVLGRQNCPGIAPTKIACLDLLCSDDEEMSDPFEEATASPRGRVRKASARAAMFDSPLLREGAATLCGKASSVRNLHSRSPGADTKRACSIRNLIEGEEPRHPASQSFKRMTSMPALRSVPTENSCVELISDDESDIVPKTSSPRRSKKSSDSTRPPKSPLRKSLKQSASNLFTEQRSSSPSRHGSSLPNKTKWGGSMRKPQQESPESYTKALYSPGDTRQTLRKLSHIPGPAFGPKKGETIDKQGNASGDNSRSTDSTASLSDFDKSNSTHSSKHCTSPVPSSPKNQKLGLSQIIQASNRMGSPRTKDSISLQQILNPVSHSKAMKSEHEDTASYFSLTYKCHTHISPRTGRTKNGLKNVATLKEAMNNMNASGDTHPSITNVETPLEKTFSKRGLTDTVLEKVFTESPSSVKNIGASGPSKLLVPMEFRQTSTTPQRTDSAYLSSVVKDMQESVADVNTTLECFAIPNDDAPPPTSLDSSRTANRLKSEVL